MGHDASHKASHENGGADEIDVTGLTGAGGGGGAPTTVDYLVGTADAGLSAEIVVGTSPGGELGGTWASPTVDGTHAGSAHHDPVTVGTGLDVTGQLIDLDLSEVAAGGELGGFMDAPTVDAFHAGGTHAATQTAAEATAASALSTHAGAADPHTGYVPESLIDAAGDLIVGTADNTVGRLAKGTALQVLRTNSGATALEWATPASGAVATDAIFDAKGDLPAGTGADAATKLTVGANDTLLVPDSTVANGLKWIATIPTAATAALTGDVTKSAGSNATTIANDAVTYAKMQNVAATSRVLGRITAGSGDVEELTSANLITLLTGAVGGLPTIVRRTSDSSAKTNNTIASDDTLLWAVGATEVWFFEAYLYLNSANVTMDAKIGFAVPSGTTMMWGFNADTASGSGNYSRIGVATSQIAISTEASTPASGSAANATYGLALAGHVITSSTPGNVNLQWAQNTTDAGNLVMKTQSMIRAWRVA